MRSRSVTRRSSTAASARRRQGAIDLVEASSGPVGETGQVQDRPSRDELIVGLRRAAAEAAAASEEEPDREARFRARVAAGVEATLERELAAGDAPIVAEAERLARILGAPVPETEDGVRELQRELAAAIRAGHFDGRFDGLIAELRAGLAERLAISRPGWTEVADDGRG
jgi:hypothetical protein